MPAVIDVNPVKVLFAASTSVPEPSFVRLPLEMAIGLFTVTLPLPPIYKLYVPETALPLGANVNVPESELIRLSAVNVITPAKLLFPDMFLNAPSFEIPVPLNVSASAPILMGLLLMSALNCSAPLGRTITPPSVVPRALLCCALTTPAVIVVRPLNVLAPCKMTLPVPTLVQSPDPAIMPP